MSNRVAERARKTELKSEFDPLTDVVIHEPGFEWRMVPLEPDMAEAFLVEDILYSRQAAEDHREFSDCLRHISGKDGVHEFACLLADILADDKVRSDIIGGVSALEGLGLKHHDTLLRGDISPVELADILISGAAPPERGMDIPANEYYRYFRPIPNLMFTRDIGAFFGSSVILSHPAKSIRRREGLLSQYVFRYHQLFAGIEIIDILDDAPAAGVSSSVSLEGGDIMVLDDETVVVGCGERSNHSGVRLLAERLLREHKATRFIEVVLPVERATMHLDTVFTVIGPEECVYFPPLFDSENPYQSPAYARTFEFIGGEVKVAHESNDRGLFAELERLGKKLPNRIKCGGESPLFQTREQWTDGANLFAARPRVAFIYERNIETLRLFEQAGFQICSAGDFLDTDPSAVDRTIITLTGGELSRGRGGARCMTLPFGRQRS